MNRTKLDACAAALDAVEERLDAFERKDAETAHDPKTGQFTHGPDHPDYAAAGGPDKIASAKAKQVASNRNMNAASVAGTSREERAHKQATYEEVANLHDKVHDPMSYYLRNVRKDV